MDISEIRIKLMDNPNDRLQAFCSITLDGCFVIRDLKIIQGVKGSFVAMPSRKLTDRCPRCSAKNCLRSRFCSECGVQLVEERAAKTPEGRTKLYADIAHPINSDCREQIQSRVLQAYAEELERAKAPGYVCTYDDYGEDCYASPGEDSEEMLELQAVVALSERARDQSGAIGRPVTTVSFATAAKQQSVSLRSHVISHSNKLPCDGPAIGLLDQDNDFGHGLL